MTRARSCLKKKRQFLQSILRQVQWTTSQSLSFQNLLQLNWKFLKLSGRGIEEEVGGGVGVVGGSTPSWERGGDGEEEERLENLRVTAIFFSYSIYCFLDCMFDLTVIRYSCFILSTKLLFHKLNIFVQNFLKIFKVTVFIDIKCSVLLVSRKKFILILIFTRYALKIHLK